MLSTEDNGKINNLLKAIDDLEGMMIPFGTIKNLMSLKDEIIDFRNREEE